MKTLIQLKCPSCGATLSIEEERELCFCQFCGTRILINDENRFTYRYIDDAEIKRADTDRLIRVKEMELEEKRQKTKTIFIIIWIIALAICFGLGAFGLSIDNSAMGMLFILGMLLFMWGLVFLFNGNKDKRRSLSDRGIKITSALANYENKNYETLSDQLRRAGFVNIKAIPLRDLSWWTARKSGCIESLTIDGDEKISEGDQFSSDAEVTITYHSMP